MKRMGSGIAGAFFMLVEGVRMSVSNIRQNRLRSFLTILGILIGVTAVIALITTIQSVSGSISDSFSSMGAGTLTVSATGTELKAGLDAEDMRRIAELDGVLGVTPSVSLSTKVARGGALETGVAVSGKNDFYFESNPDAIARGRAINALDLEGKSRVCLINADMVDLFFYGVDPVGEVLYIGGLDFTVIGILSESADETVQSMLSGSADIMIPYTTALKMNSESLVTGITVYTEGDSAAVQDSIEAFLDALYNYEDDTYEITTMDSIEDTMDSMLSMMSALLGGIASIALVVGGIGIMNMMLTSVTERTVEIGLKKAVGARPGQIQAQFLIESFLLSVVGGVSGALLGVALSAALCSVMGTSFQLSYAAIALGVGFSAAVGILFGWSPARKASKLNPIDALRRM